MRYLFIFFFLFTARFLCSNTVAVTENDPQSLVEGVSVITGDLSSEKIDVIIQGVEPIHLSRNYISQKGKGLWDFFSYHRAYLDWNSKLLEITEPSGAILLYEGALSEKALKKLEDLEGEEREEELDRAYNFVFSLKHSFTKGVTNTGRGTLSGLYNLKNQRVDLSPDKKYLTVFCPNGTKRVYRKSQFTSKNILREKPKLLEQRTNSFFLVEEEFSNGNKILYQWPEKKQEPWIIKSCNSSKKITYAWAKFYPKKGKKDRSDWDFGLETSDGRHFEYFFFDHKDKHHLREVRSNEKPTETYHYLTYQGKIHKEKKLLNAVTWPESRSIHYTYYLPGDYNNHVKVKEDDDIHLRVKEIILPVQGDGGKAVTYTFIYDVANKKTTVLDAYGTPTIYYYNEDLRLTRLDEFSKKDLLASQTRFIWGKNGTSDETNLLAKVLLNEKLQPIQALRYQYDGYGNVEKEKLIGNLTGNTPYFTLNREGFPEESKTEVYTKSYRYSSDGKHLLLAKEEDAGAKVTYSYLDNTPLIKEERYHDQDTLSWMKTYRYDDHKNLIEESEKDFQGSTHRSIQYGLKSDKEVYPGMPEIIYERAGGLLLKKTKLHYTQGGRIHKKAIFDAYESFRYDLVWHYNSQGLVEKEINALGEESLSEYDILQNKIRYKPFGQKSVLTIGYDFANRLRWTAEEDKDSKSVRDFHYKYNSLNQKTESWDEYKNYTQYEYDSFGNLLKTTLPSGGVISSTYDAAGCPITRVDARGYTTYTTYNLYNKPTEILYPDGSKEFFNYNKNGSLGRHADQNGWVTEYTYDAFNRVLTKKTNLTLESFTYDSFNLLSKTDAEGRVTTYAYDEAGRKISEKLGDHCITYEYDSLGRLFKETQGELVCISIYDNLDRVIEERKEDHQGNWLQKVSYGYSEAGDRISTTRYVNNKESKETLAYDGFHRLLKKTDPLGFETHYTYEWIPHRNVTTDPMGLQTIKTYNGQNKLESLETRSSKGETLLLDEYHYDLNDNIHWKSSSFGCSSDDQVQKTFREYDSMNRVMTLIEAAEAPEQKVTRYTYTPKGLLEDVIKPSGTILTHGYDELGYLKSLISSNRTINYSYKYDKTGLLLHSENKSSKELLTRSYDDYGNLQKETFPISISLESTYDHQGRRKTLLLPDRSTIFYDYNALYLKSVSRGSCTHRYLEHDLAGFLLKEELPLQAGVATYEYNQLGVLTSIEAPYFTQKALEFDPVGNLLCTDRSGELLTYTYSDLYQLTSEKSTEKDHTYSFDAQNNRLMKDEAIFTANALNQSSELEYDLDGNPKFLGENSLYYDALDRLISVEKKDQRLRYAYDALHRRISKKIFILLKNTWTLTEEIFYLYDGQNEIGSYDRFGNIHELRILGNAPHAEIGASIVMEIQGKIYIPFHDLHGNVSALHSQDGTLEEYSYTAFGEEQFTSSLKNPWRFSSKRTDEETGFVYYGRRYYSPTHGRFLTPDPLGLEAGTNLYAFALNAPLTHFDLYGLIEAEKHTWFSGPRIQGSFQLIGGLVEAATGVGVALETVGIGSLLAWPLVAHGCDNAITGGYSIIHGRSRDTATVQLLEKAGVSRQSATLTNEALGIVGTIGGSALVQAGKTALTQGARLTSRYTASTISKVQYQPVQYQSIGKIPSSGAQAYAKSKPIWTSTKRHTSVENAFNHWKDHGHEFSTLQNSKQYVDATKKFVSNPPFGTLTKTRTNGDVLFYTPSSNTFAITNESGVPRTMFNPNINKHPYKTNLDYFNAQK